MKLAPEVERLVAEATAIARQRKHLAVQPEHLLAAILAGEGWRGRLAPVSRAELGRLVDNALAEQPPVSGYRDGAIAVPFARDTSAVLAPRWSLLPQTIDRRWVLARLGELPAVARLVADAVLDLGDVRAEIEAARERALARRHLVVRVEHVLREMAERTWLQVALRSIGATPARLITTLDARIDTFVSRRSPEAPELAAAVVEAFHRTKWLAAQSGRETTCDLFLALMLEDADVGALVAGADVAVEGLITLLLDGAVVVSEPIDPTHWTVVFHNDDTTTQDFVRHVLETELGLTPERARLTMLRVHERGEAVVAVCPAEEAQRRAASAESRARAAGFPLLVTAVPLAGAESPR